MVSCDLYLGRSLLTRKAEVEAAIRPSIRAPLLFDGFACRLKRRMTNLNLSDLYWLINYRVHTYKRIDTK